MKSRIEKSCNFKVPAISCLLRDEVEFVFEAKCLFLLRSHPNGKDPLLGRRYLKPCGSGSKELNSSA